MTKFKIGDRVEIRTRPNTGYTWTAAWGQKGTITKLGGHYEHGQLQVTFDDFSGAELGWFHADELCYLGVLDKIIEAID
jgi:hypothetical protein